MLNQLQIKKIHNPQQQQQHQHVNTMNRNDFKMKYIQWSPSSTNSSGPGKMALTKSFMLSG